MVSLFGIALLSLVLGVVEPYKGETLFWLGRGIFLGSNVAPTPPEFLDVPAIEFSVVNHSVGSMVEVELACILLPSVGCGRRSGSASPWAVLAVSSFVRGVEERVVPDHV